MPLYILTQARVFADFHNSFTLLNVLFSQKFYALNIIIVQWVTILSIIVLYRHVQKSSE